ncbi:MAG: biotin-dependent carboxyltransferase family protein [Bacteroidota bacterium]
MTKVKIQFIKPGMMTTIQDAGRLGFLQYGVPKGGALDVRAMQMANWLVGNKLENAVLEITMMGPTIEFDNACQIAVTGASMPLKINGLEANCCECLQINKGTVISFGRLVSGCRGYLAIGGKWKVDSWLGSKSAFFFGRQNTTPESLIKKGSVVEIEPNSISNRQLPIVPVTDTSEKIKVVKGPEFDFFSKEFIGYFFSRKFRISPESNRMGYRLEKRIESYQAKRIISSGIIPGTIQITPSGQAVVLLSDAQTIGGYPRIANVIVADLDLLAQKKPGDDLEFELVDLTTANELRKGKNKKFEFLKN